MNVNLLTIVNRIVAEQGEGILTDAKRLFPYFSDYAKNEYKEDRTAFGRCIEMGAYQTLKNTRTEDERRRVKTALADQLHSKTGIDKARCTDALELLEAVIFKPLQQVSPPQSSLSSQTNAPVTQTNTQTEKAKSISVKTIIFGIAGALGGAAGELISEIFSNDEGKTFIGNVFWVAVWAAFIGLGVSVGLLAAQSIYLKKKPVFESLVKTAIIGILLGAVAGGIAQIIFGFTQSISAMVKIISQAICWGIMGWGVGWGVSTFVPNFPKKRAMAAGFLGGLIGGVIFLATSSFIYEIMGRIVGIMALGFFIGLTISYIEEALREAWLTVIWGKNETKTISLGQKPIVFGSSREADIFLTNEAPVKATVQIENAKVVMYDKTTNQRRELHNGNQVDLGKVSFVVNTKK
jgi:Ca-activated chloride channel family protein